MKIILSAHEINLYKEQGYLIPSYHLSASALTELRDAYDRLLSRNPDIPSDFMLGPHMESPGAQGVKGSKEWVEFAKIPEILDIAEQLIGKDLILWGMSIFGKPARVGKATPWHQDGDYYPIYPLETVSVWIAIDDSTTETGCMKFIPGSHKRREIFSRHWEEKENLTINLVCDEQHFDENTAQDVVLKAGQMSFHDIYMIHGSSPNTTEKRRAALVLRIMPGNCYFDHGFGQDRVGSDQVHDYGRRPLYLLRGQDRTGRNDFEIGHS
jgi:hypothetical protein